MSTLNKLAFTICLVSLVTAIGLALSMIWISHSNEFMWKSLATCGVVFLGAAFLATIGKMFEGGGK